MNIQKVFDTLQDDMDNSGLGIICCELEMQGFSVYIDNIPVKTDDIFEDKHVDLENKMGLLDFIILKDDKVVREFSIDFVDFHQIVLKENPIGYENDRRVRF